MSKAIDSDLSAPWEFGSNQLSAAELVDYLMQMGMVELCLPLELGAPSLGVDWNAAANPPTAEAGRRIRIAFDGIDGLFLIFATYDFVVGSEYVTHATRADYEALQAGVHENTIVTNGTPGFLLVDDFFGLLEKAYVYPFDNYYVALTYRLGDKNNSNNMAALKEAIIHPPYPSESARELNTLDMVMSSLQLREVTRPIISAEST